MLCRDAAMEANIQEIMRIRDTNNMVAGTGHWTVATTGDLTDKFSCEAAMENNISFVIIR